MTDPVPGQASLTPNVRIENPKVRKIIGNVLGWAVIALLLITLVDVNLPEIDLAGFTIRFAGILAGVQSLFQLLVTSPNVPSTPSA